MNDLLKKTVGKFIEAIANNLATAIITFLISGGYLFAIAKLGDFKAWVRQIPADYVLTPLVLVLVLLAAITRITLQQRQELRKLSVQPKSDDNESRMVTRYGVWWKIYPNFEYMEDFPYCSCCSPQRKLVQTEWHPDERFKCSATGTEFQLFDGIPWPLEKARSRLCDAYFRGDLLNEQFQRELVRIKTLNPLMDDAAVMRLMFKVDPLSRLPAKELALLLNRFQKPDELIHFLRQNMHHYRKLLVKRIQN